VDDDWDFIEGDDMKAEEDKEIDPEVAFFTGQDKTSEAPKTTLFDLGWVKIPRY
jgi:hypothetical protein